MKSKTKQLSAFLMVVLIISIALVPVVSSKVDNSDTKEIETLVQIPIPEVRVNIPFQQYFRFQEVPNGKKLTQFFVAINLWRHYGVGNVEFGEPVFN